MTEATHTPGPWNADFHNEQRDGGRFVTYIRGGNQLVPIAAVPTGVEGYGRAEGRANANIIAAAPAMLPALILAESFICGFEDDELQEGVPEMLAAIRGAIAQAGGEPIPAGRGSCDMCGEKPAFPGMIFCVDCAAEEGRAK